MCLYFTEIQRLKCFLWYFLYNFIIIYKLDMNDSFELNLFSKSGL